MHLSDRIPPCFSPHIKQRGRVVDGPVDLRVEHRGVAVVLRGVGHAGVPHDGVEEVSRQPHSCDIARKLLMNLEGGGGELSAPCINNEGVYLETRRDLILCAERGLCVLSSK